MCCRDLKSLNVLLDEKENAVLADFGFAKSIGQSFSWFQFILFYFCSLPSQILTVR